MSSPPFDGALLDLDGTVYLGEGLIPGADAAVSTLRDREIQLLFITNKAIERRETYCEKLNELGIPAAAEHVITSGAMTAGYLARNHPNDRIYVVGEEPLRQELVRAGLQLTEQPAETEVLLASMDRQFDYEALTDALNALDDTTAFIATNPDRTCPTATGEIPDCAAIVGAIEGATGHELHRVIGKPSQTAIDVALSRLGVEPAGSLMIGDRLETDVVMGNRAGMTTALVLSGVTDRETVEQSMIEPDYVLDSLADIGTVLESAG